MSRLAGSLVLNILAASLGTAVIEAPFYHLVQVTTLNQLLVKACVSSAVIAGLLGYSIYRARQPEAAKWVWLPGICLFAVPASVLALRGGSVWSDFSGLACSEGTRAMGCTHFFLFTLLSIRLVSYGAGALVCSGLGHSGMEWATGAVFGRFRRVNYDSPRLKTESEHRETTLGRQDFDRSDQ